MKISHIAIAAALTATTMAASASTFTATQFNSGNAVLVTLNGVTDNASIAEIVGMFDPAPAGSFAAFCVELDRDFASPFSGMFVSATQAAALSKLITGAGWDSSSWQTDAIASDDKVSISALQVGIWDIVYDGAVDLAGGNFTVDAAGQAAYGAIIDGWMGKGNGDLAMDLRVFTDGPNGQNQDILIAVPEPSTYALMIAGLGAVGFVARRRARRG